MEQPWNIEAILDKPKPSSMGMHGLLASNPNRTSYEITGIRGREDQKYTKKDLYSLIGSGAMRESIILELANVQAPGHLQTIPRHKWSGLYVGEYYAIKADTNGLPIKPLFNDNDSIRVAGGSLVLDSTEKVYGYIDGWLEKCLLSVVSRENTSISELMVQCDWGNIKTQAALWYTAKTEQEKNQYLDSFLRVSRNSGWDEATDRQTLVQQYIAAINK
ncbi:MAG: hypothetical protein NVSMB46_03260 [Candidatus Saccharimonadales bacterium]